MEITQEMKVTIVHTPAPMFNSFTVFSEFDKEKFLEEKTLTINATAQTKTRVHTSLKFDQYQAGVNWDIPGFKTAKKNVQNMWTSTVSVAYYFVRSKKQNKLEYEKYITEICRIFLERHNIEIDELTIKFIDRYRQWD